MQYSVEAVRTHLRRLIRAGYFPPERPLPSIQALAERLRVSLVTVQAAVHLLREEGLVECTRGRGIFVKYPLTWKVRGRRVALLTALQAEFLDHEPYPGLALRALREALAQDGYELVPVSLKDLGLRGISEQVLGGKWAGVILFEVQVSRLVEDLRDLCLPLVSMDYDAYRDAIPSVSFDNLRGGFEAARCLIARGHRRIVFLRKVWRGLRVRALLGQHTPLDPVTDDRMRGYQLAVQEAGLPALFHEEAEPASREGLRALFARRDAPTAVVCGDEDLAVEWAAGLAELGYAVPEDVSLVAFGGARRVFAGRRVLSAIRLDVAGLGRQAARLFLDTLKGDPPRRVVLPVHLELRDSVAARPPAREAAGVPRKK